jgi:hypothetical protein
MNCGFGRAPPLRSGSGCARTRARYNCAQVRRAPGAQEPRAVPSLSVHARRFLGPAGAHPSRERRRSLAGSIPAVETAAHRGYNIMKSGSADSAARRFVASHASARPQPARYRRYLPKRSRILPFLPRSGGEGLGAGLGERGPCRARLDPCRQARSVGNTNLPQGFLGEVGEWCSPGGGAAPRPLPPSARHLCATFIPSPACGRGCEPGRAGEGPSVSPTSLLTSHEVPAILCAPSQRSRHATATSPREGVDAAVSG